VVTIDRADQAVPLARALLAGGLNVVEITLRTPVALDAARAIIAEVADVIVGIGTITKPLDVTHAVDAGADFLVSPGTPAILAQALADAPVPALPGCATASEAMALAALGFLVLKFFPAEPSGGVSWLTAMAEPLPDIRFCPTGGVNGDNAASYLALGNVLAVGGSWVAPRQAIAAGDFAGITARARIAAALRG
jgi:2-dehydro-3-deoxyphosphogluconate aldolase / (4S)-4-hydroxy-2-oxoglutarate aldolase